MSTLPNCVFDLDGTIITNGAPLEPQLAQSIVQLMQSHRVIFASARPVRDMLPLLPAELKSCLMIGCNGGMAWQAGECLFSSQFDAQYADLIITFLQQRQVPYVLDGPWSFSTSRLAHPFHDYMRSLSQHEIEESLLIGQGVVKILILDGAFRSEFDAFLAAQQLTFTLYHHRHDNVFDISPRIESKYLALQRLSVDMSRTVAFGNDSNDFEMLRHASRSVFIGERDYFAEATHYSSTAALPALLAQLVA